MITDKEVRVARDFGLGELVEHRSILVLRPASTMRFCGLSALARMQDLFTDPWWFTVVGKLQYVNHVFTLFLFNILPGYVWHIADGRPHGIVVMSIGRERVVHKANTDQLTSIVLLPEQGSA